MADPGIQTTGTYLRETFQGYRETLHDLARSFFGADVDLSDASVMTRFLDTVAMQLSFVEERIEDFFYSAFIGTATGQSLDQIGALLSVTRRLAVRATGEITFKTDGSPAGSDIVIPSGTQAFTIDGVGYTTTEEGTLLTGNTEVTIPAQAITAGLIGNTPANTVTVFPNPISGIATITNDDPFTGGLDIETDPEFRERMADSRGAGGTATLDSIRARLLAVIGVTQATVVENDGQTTDGEGRPPGSIHVLVSGGDDQDIADTILASKAAGIPTHGAESLTALDSSGQSHTIYWDRPTDIPIFVDVTVVGATADLTEVETAVIDYIGGVDSEGNNHPGLGFGDDVIYNKVVEAVMSVDGVENATITIGTTDNPVDTADIVIADDELARADPADVDVA